MTLRSQPTPAINVFSDFSDKSTGAQTAGSVTLIAEHHFPAKWSDCIDVRLSMSSVTFAYRTPHHHHHHMLSSR
ncbi:hypothetical protein HYDPIDRAFT_119536 [Hydnomerulius pinastri MD-312]|uniref:Uncharacterized protein n=1 Tax=Hydnomerulius pinastri MD-312 TaxID=994086 RepID=A0A0C9VYF5_9AGAM|nr:hypothetical protein HYDPIDRAFT_119536 [Hydnomerulius pinastri MD-312]